MQVTAIKPSHTGSGSFGQTYVPAAKKQEKYRPEPASAPDGFTLLPQYISPHLISADTEYAISQALEKMERMLGRGITQIAINADGSVDITQLAQQATTANRSYNRPDTSNPAHTPHILNGVF